MMMLRLAVVSGASGFIGRVLSGRLRREGVRVRALGRHVAGPGPWNESVFVDLAASALPDGALAGADAVFHLAARTHATSELRQDEPEYRKLNVDGTRRLLEAAQAAGIGRVVYFSSVKAMGESTSGQADETALEAPQDAYGRTKLEAERLVLEFAARPGRQAAVLRLPLVYGVGNEGNLARMIAAVARGAFPPPPENGNRRSLVHVENAVDAAMLAATHAEANGRVYLVTDAAALSTRQLYVAICAALGKRPASWSVPIPALRALARLGDLLGRLRGRRFVFDSEALEKLMGTAWYSSARISAELGYAPRVSLREALPAIVAALREGRG